MKVLVCGASGYIGSAVAASLSRNGHSVVGLIRNADKADALKRAEVTPLVCDYENVEGFKSALEVAHVVIDAVLSKPNPGAKSEAVLSALEEAAKKTGTRKRYIYVSGCLVLGDRRGLVTSEDDAFTPNAGNQWRREFELRVTSSTLVDGVVARPGFIYGGNGGHYASKWFVDAEKSGEIVVKGNPEKVYSWLHVNDLAAGITAIANASRGLVSGEIFNLGDDTRLAFKTVLEAMGRAAGAKGDVKFTEADDPFHQFVDLCCCMDSSKAKRVLGWAPTHPSIVEQVDTLFASLKAHQ